LRPGNDLSWTPRLQDRLRRFIHCQAAASGPDPWGLGRTQGHTLSISQEES